MSVAIMYNYIFIVGRTVFWDMQNVCPIVWLAFDYICDIIYIIDMIVHAHEGVLYNVVLVLKSLIYHRLFCRLSGTRIDGNRSRETTASLLGEYGLQVRCVANFSRYIFEGQ